MTMCDRKRFVCIHWQNERTMKTECEKAAAPTTTTAPAWNLKQVIRLQTAWTDTELFTQATKAIIAQMHNLVSNTFLLFSWSKRVRPSFFMLFTKHSAVQCNLFFSPSKLIIIQSAAFDWCCVAVDSRTNMIYYYHSSLQFNVWMASASRRNKKNNNAEKKIECHIEQRREEKSN